MKIIGRLLVRKDRIAGVFIPFSNISPGLYEIREILGELTITFIGENASEERLSALSLDEVFAERENHFFTEKELRNRRKKE